MWHHPEHKTGQLFVGSYDLDKKGKRFFELIESILGKRKKRHKFKSPQQAKVKGWIKL